MAYWRRFRYWLGFEWFRDMGLRDSVTHFLFCNKPVLFIGCIGHKVIR